MKIAAVRTRSAAIYCDCYLSCAGSGARSRRSLIASLIVFETWWPFASFSICKRGQRRRLRSEWRPLCLACSVHHLRCWHVFNGMRSGLGRQICLRAGASVTTAPALCASTHVMAMCAVDNVMLDINKLFARVAIYQPDQVEDARYMAMLSRAGPGPTSAWLSTCTEFSQDEYLHAFFGCRDCY